jgi:hypothetical protein
MFQEMNKIEEFINFYDKITNIPYNYGEILNSSSCDISNDNRIVIGTKKCLILFNLNIEMRKVNSSLNLKLNANEAFSVNIISTPKLNKNIKELFSKYFHLNEINEINKKPLKRKANNNKSSKTIETNDSKILIDSQTSLFDSSIYEFIGSLNSLHTQNAQQTDDDNESDKSKTMSGFKYCKWNKNLDYNLLATITNDNQIIVFDCDQLAINKKLKENKIINVSELWLKIRKNYEKIESHQHYIDILYDMTPCCIEWSGKIEKKYDDLLFIAFKSNTIAIFRFNYSCSNLFQVEFDSMFSINDEINSNDCSYFTSNKTTRSQITTLFYKKLNEFYSLLTIGLFNGDILFKILNHDEPNCCFESSKIDVLNMPDRTYSKKIEVFNIDTKYLVLIQKEFQLAFLLVDINDDKVVCCKKDTLIYTQNQAQYKIVNFICLKSYDGHQMSFLLAYENDSYDIINVVLPDVVNDKILIVKLNSFKFDSSNPYKNIKQVFLSRNQFLFFQISDLSKINLLKKKPVDFYVNIFQLNDEKIVSFSFEKEFFHDKKSKYYSDFLWIFKSNLYLNDFNELFIKYVYEKLLKMNERSIIGNEIVQKLARILNAYLIYYFESCHKVDVKLSTSFYRIKYRDLSLDLIKNRIISFVDHAYNIGFKNLNDIEKLVLLIQSDFAIKKDFYGKSDKEIEIVKWLNDNFTSEFQLNKVESGNCDSLPEQLMNENKQNLPIAFKKYLSCCICSKFVCVDKNVDINFIECEFGHKIRRCVKSLLPLSCKKFNKCCLCESEWTLYSEDETPNFMGFFQNVERLCLFCD